MIISKAKRQQALKWTKALAELASRAPDDDKKRRAYSVVHATRADYGYSHEQKVHEILRCVSLGASTLDDLANETPFNKPEIWEIVKGLVASGHLRDMYSQLNVTGPKVWQVFPVDTINT